jgi:hypothetical protein
MKTCLSCGNIFDRDIVTNEYNFCPMLHCGGEVIDIDDNIFECIKMLNQKDYPTLYCCSGHSWNSYPYILFDDIVSEYSFESLPEGFKVSQSNNKNINISKSIDSSNMLDKLRLLFDSAMELFKWADGLPYAKLTWISFQFSKGTDIPALLKKIETEIHIHSLQQSKSPENPYDIIGTASLAPSRVKLFTKDAKAFAKANGIKVSVESLE